eukprot:1452565-Rhodomonas_salina.1
MSEWGEVRGAALCLAPESCGPHPASARVRPCSHRGPPVPSTTPTACNSELTQLPSGFVFSSSPRLSRQVEQLRLIPSKAIAFVTFKLRACAEFASEAMHCQTLDADELLNIRWAFDDPNPRAQQIAREKLEKQLVPSPPNHVPSFLLFSARHALCVSVFV